jgi:hypothetical protein
MPYISNRKLYDRLKFTAQIFLPALGSLYFALSGIWGWGSAEQVLGTILAIDTFLGALLGLSTVAYNKSDEKYQGAMHVYARDDGSKRYSLNLNGDPEDLEDQDEITFKVKKPVK